MIDDLNFRFKESSDGGSHDERALIPKSHYLNGQHSFRGKSRVRRQQRGFHHKVRTQMLITHMQLK
jgi:hypothetical protein